MTQAKQPKVKRRAHWDEASTSDIEHRMKYIRENNLKCKPKVLREYRHLERICTCRQKLEALLKGECHG